MEARIRRALSERIYVVGIDREAADRMCFKVCGSRDMVYDVSFHDLTPPRCTCMDFKQRGMSTPCKHILYLYYRVLKCEYAQPTHFRAFSLACSLRPQQQQQVEEKKQQVDEAEEVDYDCAVCYDAMAQQERKAVCPQCKKHIHHACMEVWRRHSNTCPLCRYEYVQRRRDYHILSQERSQYESQYDARIGEIVLEL